MARTMSGRVTFRISLQPSSCWKSCQRQVVALQHRSHGAIRNHHASRQCCAEVGCRRRVVRRSAAADGYGDRPELARSRIGR